MLGALKDFLQQQVSSITSETAAAHDTERCYRLATAALLMEMTRADFKVKAVERQAVVDAVQRAFALTVDETEELIDLASREADDATSLHEFTSLINRELDATQKRHIMECLWRVAFADGEVDKYEEHLARKVAGLLHIKHRDFMQTKHAVEADLRGDRRE